MLAYKDPVDHYVKVLEVMEAVPLSVRQIRGKITWRSDNHIFKVGVCLEHLTILGLVAKQEKGFVLTEQATQALQAPEPKVALRQIHQRAKADRRCCVCGSTDALEWCRVQWWCSEHLIGDDPAGYIHRNMSLLAFAPSMATGWVRG